MTEDHGDTEYQEWKSDLNSKVECIERTIDEIADHTHKVLSNHKTVAAINIPAGNLKGSLQSFKGKMMSCYADKEHRWTKGE